MHCHLCSFLYTQQCSDDKHAHQCCREEVVTASIKLDDLLAAFAPEDASSETRRHCSAISLSWLSDTAVAVVLKQEHDGAVSRKLFVFSCTGYATELQLEGDEVCHVSAELDGCVVLGQQTWSLVRDVPVAVKRVQPSHHSLATNHRSANECSTLLLFGSVVGYAGYVCWQARYCFRNWCVHRLIRML